MTSNPFSFPIFAAMGIAWLLFSVSSLIDLRLSTARRHTEFWLDLARTLGITIVWGICAYISRNTPYSFDPCLTPLAFVMVAFAVGALVGRIKRLSGMRGENAT